MALWIKVNHQWLLSTLQQCTGSIQRDSRLATPAFLTAAPEVQNVNAIILK